MSQTVTHTFVSGIADNPAAASAGEVLPSHWNANHTITGAADLAVGTSAITSGTTGNILFDNSGVLGEETISAALDFIGGTQGDILYRDSTGWAVLAPGTSGYLLSTQGAAANPQWVVPPSAGGITIGSTPISGSSANDVLYGDGSVLQQAAYFNISSGQPNVAAGYAYLYDGLNAIFKVPPGPPINVGDNWFIGDAGNFTLTGVGNFCEGPSAGGALTSGYWNMVEGKDALASCTTGYSNLAFGSGALVALIDGHDNAGVGTGALHGATTGCDFNLALGTNALGSGALVNGMSNVGIGNTAGDALAGSSSSNTFIGDSAAKNVASAFGNVVIGAQAVSGTTGFQLFEQTIIGYGAAPSISGYGSYNVVIGSSAGSALGNGGYNTIIASGENTISGGQQNVAIGFGAGVPNGGANGGISISNMIYGTNCTGTGATPSTGQIGIGIQALTAVLHLAASTTAQANLRFDPTSAASPTSPNQGDMWYDGTDLYFKGGSFYTSSTSKMLGNKVGLTGGSTGNVPTLTAGPVTGNPTKWLPYDDNGTTRYIPAW